MRKNKYAFDNEYPVLTALFQTSKEPCKFSVFNWSIIEHQAQHCRPDKIKVKCDRYSFPMMRYIYLCSRQNYLYFYTYE